MHTSCAGKNKDINVGDTERVLSGMAGLALVCVGLQRRSLGGLVVAALGGVAIHRGVSGQCAMYKAFNLSTADKSKNHAEEIKIEEAISIRRPVAEVFQFWRKLDNLPRIMSQIKSVEVTGARHSHWVARGPLDRELSWDAETINEVENELIAWRSLPESDFSNAGSVRFEDGGDNITHVRVTLAFTPPLGKLGGVVNDFLGEDPKEQLSQDLNRFKTFMEARADIPVVRMGGSNVPMPTMHP
jgi:uncharacterized membrane protein